MLHHQDDVWHMVSELEAVSQRRSVAADGQRNESFAVLYKFNRHATVGGRQKLYQRMVGILSLLNSDDHENAFPPRDLVAGVEGRYIAPDARDRFWPIQILKTGEDTCEAR
eukprot:gene3180-6419_t